MFISQPNLLVPGRTLFICYVLEVGILGRAAVHANLGSFTTRRQGEPGLETEVLSVMMVIGFTGGEGWGTGQ